ncbi:MAG: 16S rRNA (uracil(1498)-N(3))-methyltransferase [Deltaproteobacteria bacterium]|nr:16S rRNA (uracil(1498)-N(3))-methyltransferase [Deltaproteobacteria bacterium]
MTTRIRVDQVQTGEVTLASSAAVRHVGKVLRLGVGERVVAFDGRGHERPMRVLRIDGERIVLVADGEPTSPPPPSLKIVLLQALAKGDKMPRIVRACTELGAWRIVPVTTQRTIPRPRQERASKTERLTRVASEAARQCGRADVTEVLSPRPLAAALEELPEGGLRIALWEEERRPLADALPADKPSSVAILVGPEGGLSESEIAVASSAGFVTASLGRLILRTETVAPALVAILQFRYGDLGNAFN